MVRKLSAAAMSVDPNSDVAVGVDEAVVSTGAVSS
jgi:hypothetical protein